MSAAELKAEMEILRAAAEIAARDWRQWKERKGRKAPKNRVGPLAEQLYGMAGDRKRKLEDAAKDAS